MRKGLAQKTPRSVIQEGGVRGIPGGGILVLQRPLDTLTSGRLGLLTEPLDTLTSALLGHHRGGTGGQPSKGLGHASERRASKQLAQPTLLADASLDNRCKARLTAAMLRGCVHHEALGADHDAAASCLSS
jgi:hypothetical protein